MPALIRHAAVPTLVLALAVAAPMARVHAEHDPAHATTRADEAFGRAGVAKDVTRTIAIHSTDAMRFDPGALSITRGETVRLRISNDGRLPHEFVLGTKTEIDEHSKMMREMPDMVHTDSNAVRVAPGKSADVVWKFSQAGNFLYACLIPGHREAGMQGNISVAVRVKR